jgi:hypothetical protein
MASPDPEMATLVEDLLKNRKHAVLRGKQDLVTKLNKTIHAQLQRLLEESLDDPMVDLSFTVLIKAKCSDVEANGDTKVIKLDKFYSAVVKDAIEECRVPNLVSKPLWMGRGCGKHFDACQVEYTLKDTEELEKEEKEEKERKEKEEEKKR